MISNRDKARQLLALLGSEVDVVRPHIDPALLSDVEVLAEKEAIDFGIDLSDLISDVESRLNQPEESSTEKSAEALDSDGEETELSEDDPFSDEADSDEAVHADEDEERLEESTEENQIASEEMGPDVDSPDKFERAATQLALQPPQMIAFILSKLEDQERKAIEGHLSEKLMSEVSKKEVDSIPLSDKVFQTMYQKLFEE